MALILKPLYRAKIASAAGPALAANPYSVATAKAALLKSIVLTNYSATDGTIKGIYVGRKTSAPAIGDVTGTNTLFFRIAPPDLRVPANQQIVLDTEVVMSGDATAGTDYLIFEFAGGTGVATGIDCVVNGAERDQ
ncbi:MAG: hypothetical protein JNN07_19940 [Verrucomicrobiales bacterium]|nr:hypothetical protein [Verrucomicrobiales bacterium]